MLTEEFLENGIVVYQNDELYTFTSDAILLSKFATVKKGEKVADFCSGSGVVGFNLYALNKEKVESVTFFELQKELFDLSVKSISKNQLQNKFFAYNKKIQEIDSSFYGKFSLITCNPPYMKKNAGDGKMEKSKKIAMSEEELTLAELIEKISKCLKYGGRTAIVHRADRLSEIIVEMNKNHIEPKLLTPVSALNKEPYLVLIEGVKGGKSSIKITNPIIN